MVSLKIFILIYFFGGITLVPLGVGIALFLIWCYHHYLPEEFHTKDSIGEKEILLDEKENALETSQSGNRQNRSGWLRIRSEYEPEESVSSIMSGIQSYVSGKSVPKRREKYFALLKFGTLFLFDSENQEDCRMVIPVHNYKASIYPENLLDHEVYAKPSAIKLSVVNKTVEDDHLTLQSAPVAEQRRSNNEEEDVSFENTFYVFCDRPVDKEDWFFAFLEANDAMEMDTTNPFVEYIDKTRLDQIALNQLIRTVQEDSSHRHAQWLNAILGRIFLAVYKTDRINELIYHKVSKKARKVKRPGFIGEISVQNVKPGHSLPYITRPKLLSLSQNGELQAQANVHYAGSFRLEIATDIAWSYSSKRKPIKVHVELAVMLKKLTGKVLVKIKPPPSNRLWIGFYEPPQMDWKIEPIVSDKPIKLSMVTNAIESKIREFMIENMVLPNMDDFPFFETDGLGGIFGEKVEKLRRSRSQEAAEASEVSHNVEKIVQDLQAESTTGTASSLDDEDEGNVLIGDEQSLRSRRKTSVTEEHNITNNRKLQARSATDKDIVLAKEPLLGQKLLNDRSISKSTPNLLGQRSVSQETRPASSDTASIKSFQSSESEVTKEPVQEKDSSKRWSNTLAKLKKSIGKDSDGGSTKDDKSARNLSDSDSIDGLNKPRSRSSTLSNGDGKTRHSFISRMNGYIEQKLNDENETSTIGSNDGTSKRAALRAKAGTLLGKGMENIQDYRERHQDSKSVQLLDKFGGRGRLRGISSASDRRSSVSSSELPPISPSKPRRQHTDFQGKNNVPQSPTKPSVPSKVNEGQKNPIVITPQVEQKPALSPAQQYKQFVYDTLERRDITGDENAAEAKPENVEEVKTAAEFSRNIPQSSFVPPEIKHANATQPQKSRPVPPPPVPPRSFEASAVKPLSNELQELEVGPEPASQSLPKKPEKPPVPPRSNEVQKRLSKPVLPPRDPLN